MDEKLSIKVNLVDRYYPLKIDRIDEEKIRKASKMINERVVQYKQKYVDKDNQDFLAMACLQFAIKIIENEEQNHDQLLKEEIRLLNNELSDYIAKAR